MSKKTESTTLYLLQTVQFTRVVTDVKGNEIKSNRSTTTTTTTS